jgi:hypothetical protein
MARFVKPVATLDNLFQRFNVSAEAQQRVLSAMEAIAQKWVPRKANAEEFKQKAIVNLRERILDYAKQTPGDCGEITPLPTDNVTTTFKFAGAGLASATSLATAGVIGGTAALSVATAGLGLVALPFFAFRAKHAQAVATEQATLCAVTSQFNAALPAIDSAVGEGKLTAQQGAQTVANLAAESRNVLERIKKDCNAACIFTAYINAHEEFAPILYDAIGASIFTQAKQKLKSPLALGALALGGVLLLQRLLRWNGLDG